MPQVKRRAPAPSSFADEDVSVWSVLIGIVMIAALVVAVAAFMGGSLGKIENRMANTTDAAARSVGLAVKSVAIIGLDRDPVLASDVRAAAMVEPGENMFRADPQAIRTRVEATRRVVNVRVHRLWPDQIVIMADPAEPMALWHDGTAWTVIDTLGRPMVDVAPANHASLPRIAGDGALEAAHELLLQLETVPDLRGQVLFSERVAARRWNLHLAGGAVALMPPDAELAGALARLDLLERRSQLSRRGLARLDLREPGQVYLAPHKTGATPAEGNA